MNKLFIILVSILLSAVAIQAQSVINIVSTDGTSKVFKTFKEAIDASKDDDIVYLPAGVFNTDDAAIKKRIHIIGAGYNDNVRGSKGVTTLNGDLIITTDASGGSLQGIKNNKIIYLGLSADGNGTLENYSISRSGILWIYNNRGYTGAPSGFDYANVANSIISECLAGEIQIKASDNITITKCIFETFLNSKTPITYLQNSTVSNCIFFKGGNYNALFGIVNCTIENNIFITKSTDYSNSKSSYLNNIYCGEKEPGKGYYSENNLFQGNVKMDSSKVFVKYPGDGNFDFSKHDLHLTQDAKSAITGTDGKQVGIYGTANPFKESTEPINPQVKEAKINTKTNAKGQLKVEFKVEAQTN